MVEAATVDRLLHLLADSPHPLPETNRSVFEALAREGYLGEERSASLSRMAGFGNVLAQRSGPRSGPASPVLWGFRRLRRMSLRPLDTTSAALEAQRAALSRLGGEGRVRAALEMSDAIRRVRLSGLHSRYPEATERELVARFIAGAHGVVVGSTD